VIIPLEFAELALGAIPLYNRPTFSRNRRASRRAAADAAYEVRSIVAPKGLQAKMKSRASEKAYDKYEAKLAKIHSDLTIPNMRRERPSRRRSPLKQAFGFCASQPARQSVPLIADNLQDLEIVEGLLRTPSAVRTSALG